MDEPFFFPETGRQVVPLSRLDDEQTFVRPTPRPPTAPAAQTPPGDIADDELAAVPRGHEAGLTREEAEFVRASLSCPGVLAAFREIPKCVPEGRAELRRKAVARSGEIKRTFPLVGNLLLSIPACVLAPRRKETFYKSLVDLPATYTTQNLAAINRSHTYGSQAWWGAVNSFFLCSPSLDEAAACKVHQTLCRGRARLSAAAGPSQDVMGALPELARVNLSVLELHLLDTSPDLLLNLREKIAGRLAADADATLRLIEALTRFGPPEAARQHFVGRFLA
jgi:hypothetical protein